MRERIDFISAPTRTALLQMFLPVMAGMLLNLAYNIVDSLWIGNLLGDAALAALTSATPIVTLTFGLGMGVTNGMAILLSQTLAAGRKQEETRIVSSTLTYTILVSVVVVAVMEGMLESILVLMRTQPDIIGMASSYLALYLPGLIPSYVFCHLTAMLRCYGDSVFQMWAMLVTTIVNTILDPLFISVWGFAGAAGATLIAQILQMLIVLVYCRRKGYFSIRADAVSFQFAGMTARLSVPTIVQQCAPSLSSTVLTACVNGFGILATAAYGIVGKLDMLLFFPPMVLNMVLTTIVGCCIGGQREDKASEYVCAGIRLSLVLVGAFGVVLLVAGGSMAGIFGAGPETNDIVQRAMYFLVGGYLLNGVTQCWIGNINGYGYPDRGMIVTILNHVGIRIPVSLWLSATPLGLDGIWLTLLASFAASFLCAALINRRLRHTSGVAVVKSELSESHSLR